MMRRPRPWRAAVPAACRAPRPGVTTRTTTTAGPRARAQAVAPVTNLSLSVSSPCDSVPFRMDRGSSHFKPSVFLLCLDPSPTWTPKQPAPTETEEVSEEKKTSGVDRVQHSAVLVLCFVAVLRLAAP